MVKSAANAAANSAREPSAAEDSSGVLELIVCTAFGLEAIASRELQALGYSAKGIAPGRILFRADEAAICRANVWLRSADRVMVRMGEFPATDFGELFDRIAALPWEQWLPRDAEFPVNGRSQGSRLSSVPACQRIAKKAIVERLKTAHRTTELPESGPRATIDLVLAKDRATIAIDTTGPSLHKRGYRRLVGAAPLKETLAAAMVLLSFWKPDRPLVDPFCGSGTIPIEAARIGRNIAPGLHREFDAGRWPTLARRFWSAARDDARSQIRAGEPLQIIGSDIDPVALRLARRHAADAGVGDAIEFRQAAFEDFRSDQAFGCTICNPPYGERIGDDRHLQTMYEAMPHVFGRLDTWSHYVLTSSADLERIMNRAADRKRKLYNGRIQCTLYQFFGPRPPRTATADD